MKLVVAGSRTFNMRQLVLDQLREIRPTEVVCGMARGADMLGAFCAVQLGIKVKPFPADWKALGRSAGFVRNAEMAECGDEALIFWDGSSPGTKNMIDTMARLGKPVKVIYF